MSYDLRRPCVDCPFRIGTGSRFNLRPARISEIQRADGFPCHKTVDYDDEGEACRSAKQQECAGFMTLKHRSEDWTQMMRIAERLGGLNCDELDPDGEVYATWTETRAAHKGKEPARAKAPA